MAREQWKKIGAVVGLVSLILIVAGSLFAGGGKVVAVEKDIEAADLKIDSEIKGVNAEIKGVKDNASEDRESVKELAGIVHGMKVEHDEDYEELKESDHAAEMRDKEQAMQYSQILGHMAQQTAQNTVSNDRGRKIELDMAEIKVQMKTLIPE